MDITVQEFKHCDMITVKGRVDSATAPQLAQALESANDGGKYKLVASVVTPKWKQSLFATANGGADVEMALPYTIGMWDKTAPVEIEMKAGKNVLKFHGPARVTVKGFTLTPVR